MDWQKKAEETSSLKKNHLDISYHQKNVDESKEHEGKVPRKNPFLDEWLRASGIHKLLRHPYHGGFSSFSVFKMASTPDEVDHFIIV